MEDPSARRGPWLAGGLGRLRLPLIRGRRNRQTNRRFGERANRQDQLEDQF